MVRNFLHIFVLLSCLPLARAQSSGSGSSLQGTVVDPSGAAVVHAAVSLSNLLSGFRRSVQTGEDGTFRIDNLPPNPYHMDVTADGFAPYDRDVTVRGAAPLTLKISLNIAGGETSVTVHATGADLLENVPYAHNDIDTSNISKLPVLTPGAGLSDVITLTAPGVVADSNGFFHPLGDHAQVTFSIDGQPISDQQSKQFSTQVPANALQSIEIVTGTPPAEYGDKTSLVVNAVTRSGLGLAKPTGSFAVQYGSFGTIGQEATLGLGNARFGNFLTVNTERSGRFLDTPEFWPAHAAGNNATIFDRIDYQPSGKDSLHLNIFTARNWFQVPNTYDQPNQDQRQKVLTYNLSPGWQRTVSARTLVTITPFVRSDSVSYYPSRDPFADTPATLAQERRLTNWGGRADVSSTFGRHSVRIGGQLSQTRLSESFTMGVTDPGFNAVCVNAAGDPQALPSVLDPSRCPALGLTANPGLAPGLVPFDLTRGGSLFRFHGASNINQFAGYVQDSITLGELDVIAGLRFDHYAGLSEENGVQPRLGASYHITGTGTILRAGYSRTFETPYNENLILSSSTGAGGLAENVFGAAASRPISPGRRNQFNAGFQQSIDKMVQIDADYFWKYTDNAFDFGTLLNTPIQFPISCRKSKIDGFSLRIATPNLRGFQAITNIGHNRARYFGPSNGGLIFNSPLEQTVFRIDHDQALQQTTNLRYQRPNNGWWIAFTWRYDSGMVAGSVPDLESALALTAAQQAAIGFYCGGVQATAAQGIASCDSGQWGAVRLRIPAPGTYDADHNPPRIAPRNLFHMGIGTDNLFHKEHTRTTLKFSVLNLSNDVALYNFLSTFSGTHFVSPRSYQVEMGVVF